MTVRNYETGCLLNKNSSSTNHRGHSSTTENQLFFVLLRKDLICSYFSSMKKIFFSLVVQGVLPPTPLSCPATKKTLLYVCLPLFNTNLRQKYDRKTL